MESVSVRLDGEQARDIDRLSGLWASSRSETVRWVLSCGLSAIQKNLEDWKASLDGEEWRHVPIPKVDPSAPARPLLGLVALEAALTMMRETADNPGDDWSQEVFVFHPDRSAWAVRIVPAGTIDGHRAYTYSDVRPVQSGPAHHRPR